MEMAKLMEEDSSRCKSEKIDLKPYKDIMKDFLSQDIRGDFKLI